MTEHNFSHYFSEKPGYIFKKESFEVDILNQHIKINSGSGIFSLKELDFGSKILVENAKLSKDSSVLDLGCGYGIIGIALKKANPEISLTLADINERAVKLTKENCQENNIKASVFKSDIFSNPSLNNMKFDVILTNPPFSAGKKTCIEFIRQSFNHLNKEGIFQLVAPHNKGGESLKNAMLEIFGNAEDIAKKSGYRVYISIKN
jgi:16S rRNA (guanine1207-N2)-methyltransferase